MRFYVAGLLELNFYMGFTEDLLQIFLQDYQDMSIFGNVFTANMFFRFSGTISGRVLKIGMYTLGADYQRLKN